MKNTDIKYITYRYENVSSNVLMHAIILADMESEKAFHDGKTYVTISWEDVAYYVSDNCLTDGDIPLAAYMGAFADWGWSDQLYQNNSDGIKEITSDEGFDRAMRFIQSDQYNHDKPYIVRDGYKLESMDDNELAEKHGLHVREWMAFNNEYLPDSLSELVTSIDFHHLAEDIANEVFIPKLIRVNIKKAKH